MTVRHLTPVPPRAADGLVETVYAQIKRDFGAIVEPFSLHSEDPLLLAGFWSACRETLVAGQVPRAAKEAVAAAVSALNRCPYCVDAHAVMLDAVDAHGPAAALIGGRPEHLRGSSVQPYTDWAAATRSPGATLLAAPPFPPAEVPEVLGTAVCFHYVNRLATVTLGPSPLPPARGPVRRLARRAAGRWFARAARRDKPHGSSASLLPAGGLPPEFGWAAGEPVVATAMGAWATTVQDAGAAALPPAVRALAEREIGRWDGADPGLSRGWVEAPVATLADDERPAARLVLLTALAPHQVDDDVIAATGFDGPGLLGALCWAAFAAARRIGTFITPAPRP